ncbi:MAG: glycosyltransferase family 39 protein [Anaerolineales bacterium]
MLVASVGLSVVLRIVVALALGQQLAGLPGTADQISYHTLASRLVAGNGFSFDTTWWPATRAEAPTAAWSFLYTYFLAGVHSLLGPNPLGARLIQASAIGILHPLLAFAIGRRVFGATAGLAAAGITAVYAYFVYYSASLMTEPFYIVAVLASFYLAIRLVDRAIEGTNVLGLIFALGLALGIAVLLRQVFLLFIPILILWMWLASGRHLGWRVLLPSVIVMAMVLPFTAYNSSRFDSFVLLNTNAGFAFFWANHPIYGTQFEPILSEEVGSYQSLIPEELLELNEAALSNELLRRGINFVIDDPVRFIELSISRIPTYFMFWPSPESSTTSNFSRVLSFGLLLPFMLYGLVKSWLDRGMAAMRDPIALLTLFVVVYSVIHLLSWSLIRYRLPVDAVLVIFAGLTLVGLAKRSGVAQSTATQRA